MYMYTCVCVCVHIILVIFQTSRGTHGQMHTDFLDIQSLHSPKPKFQALLRPLVFLSSYCSICNGSTPRPSALRGAPTISALRQPIHSDPDRVGCRAGHRLKLLIIIK